MTWGRGGGSARPSTSGWRGIRGALETLDETGGVNDGGRIAYLAAYTKAVEAAVASGAEVRGYFAWSILDNLEWGAGFANRFGLVYVDYATLRRVPKASFDWFAKLIRAQQQGGKA